MSLLTLADYQGKVNRALEETGTYKHFTDASGNCPTLTDAINFAAMYVARKTKCLKKIKSFSFVATTREYAVPADFFALQEENPGYIYDLDIYLSYRDTNLLEWGAGDKGTPSYIYLLTNSSGVQVFGFSPTPSAANTCKVFYYAIPTTMAAAGDICLIPDVYQDTIVEESVRYLMGVDKRYMEAQIKEGRVERNLQEMKADQRRRGPQRVSNLMWNEFD